MLDHTLHTTKAVAVEVRRAAEDLSVVATVLEQELPKEVQVGDVALAIAHADELEKKLEASAAKLVEANEALAHEIEKRVEVTKQRDESEARVAELTKEVDNSRAS